MSGPGGKRAPDFSIVIPAYNSRGFIGAAVRSCIQQTHRNLEVIVVDDGSTDDTADVVSALGAEDSRVLVITTENRGGAAARNAGADAARGRLLTFLDSDDLLMPDYLAAVGRALSEHPAAGFAYCWAWVLDEGPRRIRRELDASRFGADESIPAGAEELISELLDGNFIGGVRTLRPEALASVGGYDEGLRYVEDYDLWLRLIPRGWEVVRLAEPLAILRDRADALHTDQAAMFSTLARVLEKVSDDEEVPERLRTLARRRRDDQLEALAAVQRPAAAAAWRARVATVALRRRLRPWRFWHREPPAEVAAAFADLKRL